MRSRRVVFIVTAFACIISTGSGLGQTPAKAPSPGCRAADTDDASPVSFVTIVEVTRGGRRIPIMVPALCVSERTAGGRVHAEVDRDSRIEIQFDRGKLERLPTDASITVKGRLLGDGTDKALEIRNYGVIGKTSEPASTFVHSRSRITSILWGLIQTQNRIDVEIQGALASVQAQHLLKVRSLEQALERAREDERREDQQLLAGSARLDSARTRLAALRAIERTENNQVEVNRLVSDAESEERNHQAEVERLLTRLQALRATRRAAEDSLNTERNASGHDAERRNAAPLAAAGILAYRKMIEIPLKMIIDSTNLPVVTAMVQPLTASTEQVVQEARDIVQVWLPQLAETTDDAAFTDRRLQLMGRITSGLRMIVPALKGNSEVAVAALVRSVKNTDITIPETGAQVGNTVVITIANEPTPKEHREIVVRLRVAQFGLKSSLGEAFSLYNRVPSVDANANQAALDNTQRLLAQQPLTTPLSTADTVFRFPKSHKWAPGYSFSSGWTYRGRASNPLEGQDGLGGVVRNAFHWLEPSFGIQVGLPRFITEQAVFKRELLITPVEVAEGEAAKADTAVSVNAPTMTEISTGVDVTLGGYVGVWNNMVVFGYGRHLTADRPRRYMSVGISFVRIAQSAIQSLSAGP